MEEEFEPKKLLKAKTSKVESNNSSNIQIKDVIQSQGAKLKLIPFSLDSDDEDNPDSPPCKQTNISKIVPHAEKENIVEESQKTEDLIENSDKVLINTKKHKRKLDLSSKKSHCGNENVNTYLKISDINIDNSMNFEDFDNLKSISHSSKRTKYSNEQNSSNFTPEMHPFLSKQYDSNCEDTHKKKNHAETINNCEHLNEMPSTSGCELPRKKNKIKLFHQDLDSYDKMHSQQNTNEKNENSGNQSFTSRQESFYILNDLDNQSNNKTKTEKQKSSTISTPRKRSLDAFSFKLNNLRAGKEKKTSHGVERIIEEVVEQSILNDQTVNALKNLNIIIDWNLPISHKLDSGSHNLSRMKKAIENELRKEGLVWKNKVYYSDEECETIQRNWEEFSVLYGFEDPKVFFRSKQYVTACKYSERLKFKQFLAKGLPERPLYSVYHKFIELYAYPIKGKWNEKEDMILTAINNANYKEEILKKHIIICKALDRNWMGVYRRLKLLEYNKEMRERAKSVEWTSSLMINLLKKLLEMTNSSHIEALKHADISYNIWNSLGHEMDIPAVRLKTFWCERFYAQLFASRPIGRNALRIELIEWLYNSPYNRWNELSWEEISDRFYDVGKLFIYVRFRKLVQANVPKEKWGDFRECIDELYHNYLPELKSGNKKEQILTRLKYCPEKNTLEEIEEAVDLSEKGNFVEYEDDIDTFNSSSNRGKIENNVQKSKKIKNSVQTKLGFVKTKLSKKSLNDKEHGVEEAKNVEKEQNSTKSKQNRIDEYFVNDGEYLNNERMEYKQLEVEQSPTNFKNEDEPCTLDEDNYCTKSEISKNRMSKKIQSKHIDTSYLVDKGNLTESIQEHIHGMYTSNKERKKNKKQHHEKDEDKMSNFIAVKKSGNENQNDVEKYTSYENDELAVIQLSDTLKKSNKKKQRICEINDKPDQNMDEANYIDERVMSSQDKNNIYIKNCKKNKSKHESLKQRCSDKEDINIFDGKEELNIANKSEKSRKKKNRCSNESYGNEEDSSIENEEEIIKTDAFKKPNKIKHKIIKDNKNKPEMIQFKNDENNYTEDLFSQENNILSSRSSKKSSKKKHKNMEERFSDKEEQLLEEVEDKSLYHASKQSSIKNQHIQFKSAENNYTEDLFSQENNILSSRSSKKSSKKKHRNMEEGFSDKEEQLLEEVEDKSLYHASKPSSIKNQHIQFKSAENNYTEDLFSQENNILSSKSSKKSSKKKHRNIEERFSDKEKQLLEEVEDTSLYHASKPLSIKNQHNLEESNTEMDYTFFRKSKDINATSTVKKSTTKIKLKDLEEGCFNASIDLDEKEK